MARSLCWYSPDGTRDCIDLGCHDEGGRCVYLGGRRANARCGCRAGKPSPNIVVMELAMDTLVNRYRDRLTANQPERSERLFEERFTRYRNGDEAGWREISGAYLLPVLDWVESLSELPPGLSLDDAVQEANAGMVEAIHTFKGSTTDEFWEHAQATMRHWLDTLDNRQD